jgi:hypothetical protein
VLGRSQAAMTIEEFAWKVNVTAVDGTDWHAQVQQHFDDLQEGANYTVRFRAKADSPRGLGVAAHIAEPDWHQIGFIKPVSLSVDWQSYELEFQAKQIAAKNMIVFSVGERTGTVWIAEFGLTKGAE